jgi:nitroreductase
MEIFEAIRGRRSIRHFKDIPVPPDMIEKIIDCGRHAPSACNVQGWRFIVVTDDTLKQKIVNHGGSLIIRDAPVGILTCYDSRSENHEYGDWEQSAAAAIENMLIAAHAFGLGGCWICHLPNRKTLRHIFNIPSLYDPVAYVAIGYPFELPRDVQRKQTLSSLYAYNHFPPSYGRENRWSIVIVARRVIRRCFYALPLGMKKPFIDFAQRYFVKKFEN